MYLLCIRGSVALLRRRAARHASACPEETLPWRRDAECATRRRRPRADPQRAQTKTDLTHWSRTAPWLGLGLGLSPGPGPWPRLRGGHVAGPGGDVRPLLSSGARGLCGGKPRPPQDPEPDPDREQEPDESQRGSVHVPGHGLFKFKELHENPWTIPNLLCVCRIVLSPYLGYLIIHQHFYLSLALFTLAGATDMLDGYIARTWPNQKSALGSALDPLADKILISVLYVSLTYAQLIPAPLTALVIFRDIGLIAAVFWVRYKTVPSPVTLSKFFNPCYTTAQLTPTFFSKVNTAIQLFLVAASLAAPVFKYTDSPLLQSLWYITAVTTAASGYSYWHYGRKTVRVLNTKSP
ncbi:Cardiolipin synthase (CMP-forming) [Merluccius polli]|uniref:Cardiolipin synthase (CMP-forming) n=1 Tax=Merluccius polli TaxID=89951 RepID=A0AA47LZQ8_MERPO|nr:Cardiolipin synthase (CMP-forming) [Merluccius polli]